MKHTMLTSNLLTWYESKVDTSSFTPEQIADCEHIAYCACMCAHNNDCGGYATMTDNERENMLRILRSEYGNRYDLPIPTEEKATADTVSVDELADGIELSDNVGCLNDYRASDSYLCDIISEIADGQTSIYYADILAFISKHPDALADVINEGLYDPSENYDLYAHGQAAEYMFIERELYDDLENGLLCCAVNLLRYDLHRETIPADLADRIREWCEDADTNDRMSDLADLINDYFEEVEA